MVSTKIAMNVSNQSAYTIDIGSGLVSKLGELVAKKKDIAQVVIISDAWVAKRFGFTVQNNLRAQGHKVTLLSFPPGEKSKTQTTATRLQHAMLKKKYGRDTLIVALGGGVVGDIAGYVAATYLRGVPYINIPTTFLAMVDSSIGGKTGIDTPYGKNTVGAFWQPSEVIMDVNFIFDLPKIQFVNGLLEAIKTFFTSDALGLRLVGKLNYDNLKQSEKIIKQIIVRSVRVKIGVARRDERELNERKVLNFGHTIGHALETLSNYSIPHGFAVGYGMLAEAKISELLGILSSADFNYLKNFLAKFGIDGELFKQYSAKNIIAITKGDKKARGGKPCYVLLQSIGQVYLKGGQYAHAVDDEVVKKAVGEIAKIED